MAADAGPSPAWLWAALAAPHAWGLAPLLAPHALSSAATALGHADAAALFMAASLVLAAAQAGAVLQWLYDAHAAGGGDADAAALPLALRAVVAAPLLAAGGWLKLGAYQTLGRGGLYFARQLRGRERPPPWCTASPFTVTGATYPMRERGPAAAWRTSRLRNAACRALCVPCVHCTRLRAHVRRQRCVALLNVGR
jgi:hypothetical protein